MESLKLMKVWPSITLDEDVVSQIELYARSESSSDSCKDKSSCEKPTTTSTLGIILAVVIPVVVVICVLGYFLFRNYRKEKRERNEHDPDFDENGEATALPDFPFSKGYEFEDPFKSQRTDRYTYFKSEAGNSNASFAPTAQGKPFIEEFILPYQHQTGSKVSLDDYARQIGGFTSYGQNSRTSLNLGGSSRSSMSNIPALKGASETSPQKSNLRSEMVPSQKSPSKSIGNKDYVNIPNYSFSQHEFQDTEDHSDLESVSDSNSDSSREDNSDDGEKVAVKNNIDDSNGILHSTFQSADEQQIPYAQDLNKSTTNELFDTTHEDFERIEPNVSMGEYAYSNRNYKHEHNTDEEVNTLPGDADESEVKSPFENELVNDESLNNEVIENTDFNFSGNKEVPQGNSTFDEPADQIYSREVNNDVKNHENLESVEHPIKSPRMSAFNLLQNDSDEEEQDKVISAEQEEEIQRMKSIYKVYFDRANSQKSQNPNVDINNGFQYDESNPLPSINNEEEIRINNQLKVDTSDKRLTTTSSIYTDLPETNEQQMQYLVPNQAYQDYNYQPPHQKQNIQQQQGEHYQQENLPPLQQLPNASEIRKSTIQTYTDFHPRMKNSTTMPNLKHPYNPMEDVGVWSSPVNSPATQSQTSFMSANSGYQSNVANGPPSATQLSRTSVVLLNPVTEITKSRTFKPAGSLGGNNNSLPSSPSLGQQQFQQSLLGSESELIPGNRKSDIRRMMNSNF